MTVKSTLIGFFFVAIVLAVFAVLYFSPKEETVEQISADDIESHLTNGDIICRLGDQLWSLYFRDISPVDKRFSHLGIVRITNGETTIINAEGLVWEGKDFVNEVTLQDFVQLAKAVDVYRFSGIDEDLIAEAAYKMKGKSFDWDFDLNDSQKLYCTELLFVVLNNIFPEYEMKTMFQKELGRKVAVSHR
ncbi:MAG: hypothetical protein LBG27_13785 [Spirochaetaceae bacterium]|jgi:hypothetical protein|nr:hypothetical protein [Spirochaetaceae bacterium]